MKIQNWVKLGLIIRPKKKMEFNSLHVANTNKIN